MFTGLFRWVAQIALATCMCLTITYWDVYAFDSRLHQDFFYYAHHVDNLEPFLDMYTIETETPSRSKPPSGAVLRRFTKEYHTGRVGKRDVFEKYLDALGADSILNFLEATHPFCHGEAHELGGAIYAKTKDLGTALRICGRRCTVACMHGVVREAFQDQTLEQVQAHALEFCQNKEMSEVYKSGNCVHALGHALMFTSGYDLAESLDVCSSLPNEAMGYFCGTGVYMEYFIEADEEEFIGKGLHYPCDIHERYPAACYRFKVRHMLYALYGDVEELTEECLALSGTRRLGCFHGLGAAVRTLVASYPASLGKFCRHGTTDDQIMCIEGVVEKLAEYDEEHAVVACSTLNGRNAQLCYAAAKQKMYRLIKPTIHLYVR